MDINRRFLSNVGTFLSQRKVPRVKRLFGAHSAGEIPVPIPNTEVKPSRGNNTARAGN